MSASSVCLWAKKEEGSVRDLPPSLACFVNVSRNRHDFQTPGPSRRQILRGHCDAEVKALAEHALEIAEDALRCIGAVGAAGGDTVDIKADGVEVGRWYEHGLGR